MEESGQLHIPTALPSGQNPDTHWIKGGKDDFYEEKNLLSLPGIEPPTIYLLAIQTTIHRLHTALL